VATAVSSHLAGAHFRFGPANPKEGFRAGIGFLAPLAVGNVGSSPAEASISVDYTDDSGAHVVSLGPILLAPGEAKVLELSRELMRRGVSGPVEDAGVDISYNGVVGSVLARLTSLDQTGDYSFDVPLKDPLAGMNRVSGNYPWRLDNGYNTVLHLKNTIDKEVYATVQV